MGGRGSLEKPGKTTIGEGGGVENDPLWDRKQSPVGSKMIPWGVENDSLWDRKLSGIDVLTSGIDEWMSGIDVWMSGIDVLMSGIDD